MLLAWSGGKDAAWTLHVLRQRDDVRVVGLLSTVRLEDGRATLQEVSGGVLAAQARAAGLPLLPVPLRAGSDNQTYARAMADALHAAAARWPGLRTVAFGDLLLADIRDWRAAQMARIGWDIETPLFGADTAALESARGQLATFQTAVNKVAAAEYMGGRTDGMGAMLTASSPQGLIDLCRDIAMKKC